MKTLRDLEGNEIKEEERVRALEKAHFLWDESREGEEEEEEEEEEVEIEAG